MMVRIENVWPEDISLQLATHDPGKGFEHRTLKVGESIEVDESVITETIKKLAKKNRFRKVPALVLVEMQDEEIAVEEPTPAEELPVIKDLPAPSPSLEGQLMEFKKDQLLDIADDYHVECSASDNKPEIINRLVGALSPEQLNDILSKEDE
jgi:hypothetical protein